jgi:hypothetical protein
MRFLLALWAAAGLAAAQQNATGDDARALLLEVRKRVLQTVERLPRYLCTETIDRSVLEPEQAIANRSCDNLAGLRKRNDWRVRKHSSDRLRLDVAVSRDDEMYSWVGDDRFEDGNLASLVGSGATSTGVFASFLGSIFGSDAANFTYNGDTNLSGRVLSEFGFHVPLEKSNFRIGNKDHYGAVDYYGTFLADPATFELVRLTVHADQLPPELRACESTTTLDYGSIRLNGYEFLIPRNATWRVVDEDGIELDSRTAFANCHEFVGESTLSFDGALDKAPAGDARDTGSSELPADLPFQLALTTPIDSATAAAGDPFRAELTRAIRDKRNGILVPKGAAVRGRIVRIERTYQAGTQLLTLGVRLETINVNGVQEPLRASLTSVVKRHPQVYGFFTGRQDLGTFGQIENARDPAVGVLEFRDVTGNYVIRAGLTIEGRTAAGK